MICQNIKCGKEHDRTFGSGKYCSRACANSRQHSVETKLKTSNTIKNSINYKIALAKKKFDGTQEKVNKYLRFVSEQKLLAADFNTLSQWQKRSRIILEQKGHCNKCGLSEWLGQSITLELEHKDGNNINDLRENLEILCPNCHSQTSTWRGRNNRGENSKIKLKAEDYANAFLKYKNIKQALISLNLTTKGRSYYMMYKSLNLFNIPYERKRKSKYIDY